MKESVNESVFRLADDDQYDEVEEEVTERDEEYEDEDYDEEYDDQAYDEEEPYEEEPYDDGYDDGYDDQYYDDRLNKVLDEIADLKRGMAAPAVIQQPPAPPVYPPQNATAPYVYTNNATPTAGQNGFSSEVVMYNEISRLRDELSKTQNTQSLHMELSRLKDEMEKDQRMKEDRYLDEIRRLNEKIENLQKNESSPQSDNTVGYLATGSEGGTAGGVNLDKLISINEAILMNAKSVDQRTQAELSAIKDRLNKLPDFDELNKAVAVIRKSAKTGDPALAEQVSKLKEAIGAGGGTGDLAGIESRLDTLSRTLRSGGSADNAEVLRQLFEIKTMIGCASLLDNKRNAELLSLYNELAKARFIVASQASFTEKLNTVAELTKKLSTTSETDLSELIAGANGLSEALASLPVDKKTLDELSGSNASPLPRDRYEAALTFADLSRRAHKDDPASVTEYLSDLVAAKNVAAGGKGSDENEKLYAEIMTGLAQADRGGDPGDVREALDRLAALTVGELIEIPRVNAPRSIRVKKPEEGQAVMDKLAELKKALESAGTVSLTADEPVSQDIVTAVDALRAEVRNLAAASAINETVEELKNEYVNIVEMLTRMTERRTPEAASTEDAVTGDEVQFSNNELSTQLYNVRDELLKNEQDATGLTQDFIDLKLQESAEKLENALSERTAALTESLNSFPTYEEDLAYIKTRLDDWDVFVSQIGDLRADILTIPESLDVKPQLDKLYEDLLPQFDKLYEDLAAAINTSETNLGERINQAVSAAVTELNAGVEGINDTIAAANSASGDVLGAVSDLAADFEAYSEKALLASDGAAADRAKLMDDIAYVREQLEVQVADENGDTEVSSLRDRLLDELELLAGRMEELESSVTAAADGPSVAERITEIGEQIKAVDETANNLFTGNLDFQTSVYDDLTFIKEKLAPDENTDHIAGILADLRSVLDKLGDLEQNASEDKLLLVNELDEIKEQLHLKELEPSINQVAESEEERKTLLTEIADIRERLASVEDNSAALGDTVEARLNAINEGLSDLRTSLAADETLVSGLNDVTEKVNEIIEKTDAAAADLSNIGLIMDDIAELKAGMNETGMDAETQQGLLDKLDALSEKVDLLAERSDAYDQTLGNIPFIMADIEEIKNGLAAGSESAVSSDEDATAATLNDLSAQLADVLARVDENAVDLQSLPLLIQEIEEIKAQLTADETPVEDGEIAERLNSLSDRTVEVIEQAEANAASLESLQAIIEDIVEIKDKISTDYDKMQEDLSYIRTQIEAAEAQPEQGETLAGEDLTLILDDLNAIREKLNTEEEYDVMAEILSLREEVKAARIVDQNDVSGELEAVRADILDRYNALIDEIKSMRGELSVRTETTDQTVIAPTNDELNMVLNEIVSLRDEVQAYKDEITAFAETAKTVEPEQQDKSDEIDETSTIILDELTNLRAEFQGYKEETVEKQESEYAPLRADIETLKDNLEELKDMIARRTTIAESEEGAASTSNELNVVLDEIINIKDELQTVRAQMDEAVQTEVGKIAEQLDRLSEEEPETETDKAFLETVRQQIAEAVEASLPSLDPVMQEIEELKAQLADLQLSQMTAEAQDSDGIREEIAAIREQLSARGDETVAQADDLLAVRDEISVMLDELRAQRSAQAEPSDEMTSVRDEIAALLDELRAAKAETQQTQSLKAEIAELKEAIAAAAPVAAGSMDEAVLNELSALREELTAGDTVMALRDEITALKEQFSMPAEPDVSVLTEVMSLREEVTALKEQLAAGVPAVEADNSGLMAEILALREEMTAVKEAAAQTENGDYGVLTEILALRDEFQELKNGVRPDDGLTGSLEELRADVQSLRDEPDLSVINEILALRDEFQAMKEQIRDTTAPKREQETKSAEEILTEVQSLRDQLFAISMANVNDGTNDTYESYNNIILDEITALRDELNAYKAADKTPVLMEEVADIKDKLAGDDKAAVAEQLAKLKADIEALKNLETSDATNNAILSALDNLKEELANQREADVTTLNFMAEMAHLLERQNQYINQNSNAKLTDEIESLKAEIATSLNAPSQQASKLMDEIAALKAELSQSLGESVVIDNQAILDELAALKEEISKESPTGESQLVLNEIARLKDEIGAITEKEKEARPETELSQSISDLKNELSQIADLVTDDQKPAAKKPAAKKPATKTGAKTGGKTGTKKPAAKKPAPKKENASELSGDELISKIDSATFEIPRTGDRPAGDDDFNPMLDFNYQPPRSSEATGEDMDVASRLAKQVANKLIMEQLVQQLGDGGVPRDKVEEIVKDILPQEFTTVAMNEQSDRVRRLANSLVLDKLRSRLTGKKPE